MKSANIVPTLPNPSVGDPPLYTSSEIYCLAADEPPSPNPTTISFLHDHHHPGSTGSTDQLNLISHVPGSRSRSLAPLTLQTLEQWRATHGDRQRLGQGSLCDGDNHVNHDYLLPVGGQGWVEFGSFVDDMCSYTEYLR